MKKSLLTLFTALICAISAWATDYKQGKLPGAFSISSTQVVYFAQGNLQYTGSWRFADNQWDIYGDTQTDNHRDLFRWGSGTTPNMTCSESVTQFNEWGANAITNGGNTANMWRTLSKDEWKYLLAGRATPENLTAVGTVESVEGLILLPDDWTLPSGASLNVGAPNYSANVYNSAQWAVLEAAGAVFLPHAGMLHDGIYVRSFEEFSCFYWMSSGNPNEGDVLGSSPSISYWDNETGNNIDYAGPNMSLYGCYSVPVRLVSETPAPTASISSAPTAIIGLVYDGSAQALVNAGSSSTGTVYYSLDNSTWSTAIPTATNAGSYTVYYKVVGDANHSDYTPASNTVTVTINVASITTAGSVTTYYSTFASAVSAWEANSTLTLLADVTTNSKVEVSNMRTIDLNGYGITMTGTDCIFLLQSGGNLTMIDTHPTRSTRRFNVSDHLAILADGGAYSFQGGYLTGGRGSTALDWYYRGGAVFLKGENCRFTMRGGMILGNRASFGGGVQIRRGRFVMEGGAIIYNRATERDSHGGGAIFVDCGSGQLTLGGTALIEHNYSNGYDNGQVFVSGCTDGALVISGGSPRVINSASTNNIIHNSAIMTITGALTADADLPLYVQPGVLTSGYDTYHHGVDPSTFFSIQNEGYIMRLNANGEVEAVTPSSVSVAPIAKTGLVYTGAAQELVTAGTANGGTMYYSLNNSTWSTDVPTGTDAGNYTVYYKVVGDANHSDYIPASNTIAVTIAPFTLTIQPVGGASFTVNTVQTATVYEVKQLIEAEISIAPEYQRLIFAGKQLENGRTLSEYNITNGTTVNLSYRITIDINANEDPNHAGDFYATFFDSSKKYALPNDGTEAYAAEVSGDALLLHKIAEGNDVLPANTAVIFKATSSTITLTESDADAVTVTATNNLHGVNVATSVDDIPEAGNTIYVLSGEDGVVGFYKYVGATLGAHKAYIALDAKGAAKAPRCLVFHTDEEQGIEDVQNAVQSTKLIENGQLVIIKNGIRYNAQGQIVK